MALPTLNDVTAVDPVLQNFLVGFAQGENRFVALRAFPGMSVAQPSGTFYKFTQFQSTPPAWGATGKRPSKRE